MPKFIDTSLPIADEPEPRWPALLAVLAVGGLYAGLPESVSVGPWWLLLAIVIFLLIPTIVSHYHGRHNLNIALGHALTGILTMFLVGSLVLLITELPAHKEPPIALLRSGGALWFTNVLVFASWYWRLDAGGPHGRERRPGHPSGAFLFPQMTLKGEREPDGRPWSPLFIDYLFLAFNTSTALSPTDVPVLSRWAKALVMVQSATSLTIVIILLARGVNIL